MKLKIDVQQLSSTSADGPNWATRYLAGRVKELRGLGFTVKQVKNTAELSVKTNAGPKLTCTLYVTGASDILSKGPRSAHPSFKISKVKLDGKPVAGTFSSESLLGYGKGAIMQLNAKYPFMLSDEDRVDLVDELEPEITKAIRTVVKRAKPLVKNNGLYYSLSDRYSLHISFDAKGKYAVVVEDDDDGLVILNTFVTSVEKIADVLSKAMGGALIDAKPLRPGVYFAKEGTVMAFTSTADKKVAAFVEGAKELWLANPMGVMSQYVFKQKPERLDAKISDIRDLRTGKNILNVGGKGQIVIALEED